jgi:hypothetical protein
MSQNNDENTIDLIVPIPARTQTSDRETRAGGETQGLKEVFVALTGKKTVGVDSMKQDFEKCLEQVNKIISNLKTNTVLGWEADSVTVGLAVSAEGSIGIATVGAEATIEIEFVPRKNSGTPATTP